MYFCNSNGQSYDLTMNSVTENRNKLNVNKAVLMAHDVLWPVFQQITVSKMVEHATAEWQSHDLLDRLLQHYLNQPPAKHNHSEISHGVNIVLTCN